MRILFVWTGITRCAGDCWRELASRPEVRLRVVIDAQPNAVLEREILHDLDYSICDVANLPSEEKPDVLFVVGWHSPVVRHYVELDEWRDVPKICCFDMPWRTQFRCVVARFVLWRYLRRFNAAFVPGELSAKYARWLGFTRVELGFLAIDVNRFAIENPANRRGFVFVGRKSAEKRIDLIESAYSQYRAMGGSWDIAYHHDTSYGDLPQVYAKAGCLVLFSEHDAWPLVALEARSAGCEVIMSDRCGNRAELATEVVSFGDISALARAMFAVEHRFVSGFYKIAEIRSKYDKSIWANRVLMLSEAKR